MLTVDQVLARRRGDKLTLIDLSPELEQRALGFARVLIDAATQSVGATREEFEQRCRDIDVDPDERRLALGLEKLVTDRCEFAMATGAEPYAVRSALFKRATSARRELEPGQLFDRDAIVATVGTELGLEPSEVEQRMYGDLKSAHRLVEFDALTPEQLVHQWRRSQRQAVLLKATRVVVAVKSDDPAAYRALFHKLKFLRLLFVLQPLEHGGYKIEIDGPFSLFKSVTKYGLQLAMLLPALDAGCRWKLRAEVVWGKDKKKVEVDLRGGSPSDEAPPIRLADDIATFVEQFRALDTVWRVDPATDVLHLPGAGLCVPDLAFTHRVSGDRIHFEVMGFWSRDAVWKRVELVEAGLQERVLFAVSDRLRVSESVLGDDLPGSLYVYKGVMSARVVAERLELLRRRST